MQVPRHAAISEAKLAKQGGQAPVECYRSQALISRPGLTWDFDRNHAE